jgi:hypothetical protein
MQSLGVRRLPLSVLVATAAVILAISVSSTSATALPLVPPEPPFHVSGNKVLGHNEVRFVPQGFVIDCAAYDKPVETLCKGETEQDPWPVEEMLKAAAGFWHANVVRVQVAPEQLMPGSSEVDKAYLELVESIVSQATKKLGMVTILTDQTEEFDGPALPVKSDISFWKYMASRFKGNDRVMFDLYNEPRLVPGSEETPELTEEKMWKLWQKGGTYDGIEYVGDNALIKAIRETGAENVLIAESNQFDRDLSELSTHLLTGTNIVYGVEPNLNEKDRTQEEWEEHFGTLAKTYPIFPEAFLPSYEECNAEAPALLPEELDYLGKIDMGVIVWTLLPGVTTQGTDLEKPTSFEKKLASTDPCLTREGKGATPETLYGEGADIHKFFTAGEG